MSTYIKFSQNDNLLSIKKPLRLGIVGDSISTSSDTLITTGLGYSDSTENSLYSVYTSNGNDYTKLWWGKIAEDLGVKKENISNCSWSGSEVITSTTPNNSYDSSSVTCAVSACSTRRILDLNNPDIILVYMGTNDALNSCSDTTDYDSFLGGDDYSISNSSLTIPFTCKDGVITSFKNAYYLMLSKIKMMYPNAKVLCVPITYAADGLRYCDRSDNTTKDARNKRTRKLIQYANTCIRKLSDIFGYETLTDTEFPATGIYAASATHDLSEGGIHPNLDSHNAMYQKIKDSGVINNLK